ncbi:MAG: hypothetical protein WCF26_18275 [Candidatus Sulfotelmatobacter sp.]
MKSRTVSVETEFITDRVEEINDARSAPWEEFYREHTGQLETGACLEFATKYHDVRKVIPRHSH